jgi:hypothetical protein
MEKAMPPTLRKWSRAAKRRRTLHITVGRIINRIMHIIPSHQALVSPTVHGCKMTIGTLVLVPPPSISSNSRCHIKCNHANRSIHITRATVFPLWSSRHTHISLHLCGTAFRKMQMYQSTPGWGRAKRIGSYKWSSCAWQSNGSKCQVQLLYQY